MVASATSDHYINEINFIVISTTANINCLRYNIITIIYQPLINGPTGDRSADCTHTHTKYVPIDI